MPRTTHPSADGWYMSNYSLYVAMSRKWGSGYRIAHGKGRKSNSC